MDGVEGVRGWWELRDAKVGGRAGEVDVGGANSVGKGRPHLPHARLQLVENAGEAWSLAGTVGVVRVTVGSVRRSVRGAGSGGGEKDSSAIGWK